MTVTAQNRFEVAAVPCASWCTDGDSHLDQHPEDRRCTSSYAVVPTSLGKPECYTDGTWLLPWLTTYLLREWRETETRVVLHNEDNDSEVRLTLEEAATLRDKLSDLLATARAADAS